jgi:hypothetical protein
MPPVLALVVETFVKHLHDLDKVIPVDVEQGRRQEVNKPTD